MAQAFGIRAIQSGFTVYYTRTATLLEDIKFARIDGSYTNLVKKFARYKLLILDDFGISPISVDDATNLFEIIERIVNSSHRIHLKGDSLRPKYEKVNDNYE